MLMTRRGCRVIPILSAVIVACGGDAGPTGDIQVQIEDSAGVRIVTYEAAPGAVAPFRLAAQPRYRHGASPGDYAFSLVHAGRLLPDGSAVVANLDGEVVTLSPDGRTHQVLAKVGEGPGEVLSPYSIFVLGQDSVANGRFVHTRSDRPEITWRLPDGTVTQIVRWSAEPTLLTEELLDPVEPYVRLITQVNNHGIPMSRIEELVQRSMSSRYAMIGQPMPLYGSPFADADGNVWLPSYRLAYPEEGSPYTVISSDGEWVGQVETPPRFRILDVTGDLVLGVGRDGETDVVHVVVHELVPGS